jgi:hypothetical protein
LTDSPGCQAKQLGLIVDTKSKAGFPNWAKLLIGAVALCLGLTCGLLIAGAVFLKNVYDKGTDPNYKKSIARSIAEFPDPLPEGFTFGTATDLMNVTTVLINHLPEQMDISFSEVDVKDEKMKKALDGSFESGGQSKLFEETGTGQLNVANHKMEYRTGYQKMGSNKISILDGRIIDVPNKFISVTGYSEGTKPFDLKLLQKLTDSIKSIGPVP